MSELATTDDYVLNRPELLQYLIGQIGKLYVITGFSAPPASDLVLQADLLENEIKTYFPTLRVINFELALSNGVRGLYGEYMGLSILTYNKWIKAKQSERVYKEFKDEPIHCPTQDELIDAEKDWRKQMIAQFNFYKETKRIDISFPNFQYRGFVDNGLLKENDYTLYMESAGRHVIEKAKSKRITADTYNRNKLSEMIRRVEEGNANKQDTHSISQQAQTDCIKAYYDSLNELKFKDTFEHVKVYTGCKF